MRPQVEISVRWPQCCTLAEMGMLRCVAQMRLRKLKSHMSCINTKCPGQEYMVFFFFFFGRVVLYSLRDIPSMVMLDMVILATVLLWRANIFSFSFN